MNDSERVEIPNSHDDLLAKPRCLLFAQRTPLLDIAKEVAALHQLQHDIGVGLGFGALFELEEQRVRDNLHDAAFFPESSKSYAVLDLAS